MKADLHMHTTFSDGRQPIENVIAKAKNRKIDYIAITDHDIIDKNFDKWIKYGEKLKITVIPGIELSTIENNKSIHLLGYFTDKSYQDESLQNELLEIKKRREQRAIEFIKNLKKYYDIVISYEKVKAISGGLIARPHLSIAISEKYGYTHDETFDLFLNQSSKAYVPTVKISTAEGINLLKKYNCLVVLAHPVLYDKPIFDKIKHLPYDGIEAYYYRNNPNDTEYFLSFAKENNLFVTAGSDYHGIINDTKHGDIGELYIDETDLAIFLKYLNK